MKIGIATFENLRFPVLTSTLSNMLEYGFPLTRILSYKGRNIRVRENPKFRHILHSEAPNN